MFIVLRVAVFIGIILSFNFNLNLLPGFARRSWTNSTLTEASQAKLDRSRGYLRSGKYEKAKPYILAALDQATDVPKCLEIAAFTEPYAYPMNETRRQCVSKAFSLATTREDLLLVTLKARKYQFFEITRQCIDQLTRNAKTVNDLYELAKKAQEVALNDLAHLAMEKAYTGVKDYNDALVFAQECKSLGMDDLLRKVIRDLVDDENDSQELCDLARKIEPFQMRDQNRYLLRKALDKAKAIPDMEAIYAVAQRLHEPDVATRAEYFIKKGKLIQQIKDDRKAYEDQMRAWREGISLDALRMRDEQEVENAKASQQDSGFGGGTFQKKNKLEGQGSGF
jgi:hypothetical protein